ncbi:MAG: NAD(P)/FAD-dependent oxidoreductase [Nanoarchaeota archaeon]|nr:NAD(P)/FAD-dependent oxidoreductase [Nanoarchaeota archaeon]MBU1005797.1 NAD(P)/FAD-dependent oxidoreductase [Nanoarchaeota archaeon]MBU1946571.1 NAD(P)/FAD-dependent oxidoreductase [Nanoarchaeota archaeon]
MYDIVIVGAGPAGLMAASKLPKSLSFIVIDGKEKIGYPLKCGEGVREEEFVKLFGRKDYPFVRNTVHEHEIIYKNIHRTFEAEYLQIDRPRFEQWLAKDFKDKLRLGIKCEDVIIKKDCAEVITNKGILKGRLVLLCYGCNFKIQKKYKLMKKNPILLVCYGGIYKNHKFDPNKFYAYFDEKYLGYMWIFPKDKNLANVGFGTVVKGLNVKKAFVDFISEANPGMKLVSSYGGIVPCSGPIDKCYYDRLLVCGDAAGFVYAGTGEGIYFALESGRIAADVAVKALNKDRFDKGFLKRYGELCDKSFGKLMKAGIVFYDLQYLALRKKKVNELFTLPTNKEIKMMVSDGKIPFRAKLLWYLYRGLKKVF